MQELKQCPYCCEDIKVNAVKCRYCGEFIDKAPAASPPVPAVPPHTEPASAPRVTITETVNSAPVVVSRVTVNQTADPQPARPAYFWKGGAVAVQVLCVISVVLPILSIRRPILQPDAIAWIISGVSTLAYAWMWVFYGMVIRRSGVGKIHYPLVMIGTFMIACFVFSFVQGQSFEIGGIIADIATGFLIAVSIALYTFNIIAGVRMIRARSELVPLKTTGSFLVGTTVLVILILFLLPVLYRLTGYYLHTPTIVYQTVAALPVIFVFISLVRAGKRQAEKRTDENGDI